MFLFMFGSICGYFVEVFFRRYVSMKRWINPGFCKGPWLPLYGFGFFLLYFFYNIFTWCGLNTSNHYLFTFYSIILFTVAATLIEYLAGIIFIKGLHVKLWDYSNLKGNIEGVICPEFTCLWALSGLFYMLVLGEPMNNLVTLYYNVIISSDNFALLFITGIIYGLFLMDLTYSIDVFARISKAAKESKIIIKYENFKIQVKEKAISYSNKNALLQEMKNDIESKIAKHKRTAAKFSKIFLINADKNKENIEKNNPSLK
jgi:uncharacterized membrane protein